MSDSISPSNPIPLIQDVTRQELREWMVSQDLPAYRADQVYTWLYQRRVAGFGEMANLGKPAKFALGAHFRIGRLEPAEALHSKDGSIKYRFVLEDGRSIESVLMEHADHHTVCVSSQVGCAMGCDFCQTAKMGLVRNLTPGEIVMQVLAARCDLPDGGNLRNIVFMGMGEPFHNYANVMRALEIFTDEYGFNFSQRRITVSTSGLLPQIRKFGQERVKANLAVSLNGVTDEVRTQLMPVNRTYNLQRLVEACKAYPLASHRRITFEYILMKGVTDSVDDAKRLIRLLHGLKFKVNLIPYNEAPGSKYQRPDWEDVRAFQQHLLGRGVVATLRISKGQDVQGACGQLIVSKSTARPAEALPA
jgi:23S rRNA (adenine2503-C2)-methyltransferase